MEPIDYLISRNAVEIAIREVCEEFGGGAEAFNFAACLLVKLPLPNKEEKDK